MLDNAALMEEFDMFAQGVYCVLQGTLHVKDLVVTFVAKLLLKRVLNQLQGLPLPIISDHQK